MPSLADMRTKAKEAGLMKLDRLIEKRQHIPTNEFPIPLKELCERFEKLYTGCVNDVMREACLLDQNLPPDIMPLRDEMVVCGEAFTVKSAPNCMIEGEMTFRAQMLDEQARQYTLTARAKGCSEATITYKYCLRAAMNPVVSGMAGSLRTIFSGSTVSALVLNLQIQGPVLLAALRAQDMYLAGTIVLVQAVLVVVGTLLSDIALAWLDPRIRFSGRE